MRSRKNTNKYKLADLCLIPPFNNTLQKKQKRIKEKVEATSFVLRNYWATL